MSCSYFFRFELDRTSSRHVMKELLMQFEEWFVESSRKDAEIIESRDLVANHITNLTIDEIAYNSLGMTLDQFLMMLKLLKEDFNLHLEGTGVELGSGAGLFSSVSVNMFSEIDRIYAVEYSRSHATEIFPYVAESIVTDERLRQKLVSAWGSFDNMLLEDNSIDFAIEINSLHHSFDLVKTLKEVRRVLKKGGVLICLDRSHPDFVTEQDMANMLALEYSSAALEAIGFPPGSKFTRQDNGEHEYRKSDWIQLAESSGLSCIRFCVIGDKFNLNKLLRGVMTRMPFWLRTYIAHIVPSLRKVLLDKSYVRRNGEVLFELAKIIPRRRRKCAREITFMVFANVKG